MASSAVHVQDSQPRYTAPFGSGAEPTDSEMQLGNSIVVPESGNATTERPLQSVDLPLTKDCHHYEELAEVPWDIQKSVKASTAWFKANGIKGTGSNATASFPSMTKGSI